MDTRALDARTRAVRSGFGWRERLLAALSRDPAEAYRAGYEDAVGVQWTAETVLRPLRRDFPHFEERIRGRRVLDYGCGDGFQSVAMAQAGAAEVLGVDIDERRLAHARRLAEGLPNVRFAVRPEGRWDVVVSLNSFEHFPDPTRNLAEMADALVPDGLLLVTFGPPWLAPYGAHMMFFTKVPWVHLLFPERTVLRVRRLYRDDQVTSYREGMNGMTMARFDRLLATSGLKVERVFRRPFLGLPAALGRVPGLRELCVIQAIAELRKPGP